ncbi:MAG TPA: YsnF/AvaK domain-containing protein [Chloroflexota bacterium]|nr:YsnF/AvaK domain-containing protein [Chloroflexota bacterium]
MAKQHTSSSTNLGTVVGLFHERRNAELAIADLEKAGFTSEQIGYASHGDSTMASGRAGDTAVTTDTGSGSGALSGAMTGGVIGGVLGALASLAIPGVGPVVAAGILGPILGGAAAGAGIGAVGGGLVGGLVTTGVSEEDARYYDEEFRSGRSLVTVRAGDRAAEARAIIQRHGGHDRSSAGSAGSAGTMSATGASGTHSTTHATDAKGTIRVPEIEERLDVQKRDVQQGEVRVQKHVEERKETIPVTLEREEVHVERREVAERPIAPGEKVEAFKDETIRVPVRGEEAVVNKEAVVTGEVVVDKDRHTEREQVSDTVRKTHVEVDNTTDARGLRRDNPKR